MMADSTATTNIGQYRGSAYARGDDQINAMKMAAKYKESMHVEGK